MKRPDASTSKTPPQPQPGWLPLEAVTQGRSASLVALVIALTRGKSQHQAATPSGQGCLRTQAGYIGLFLLTCPAKVSAASSVKWIRCLGSEGRGQARGGGRHWCSADWRKLRRWQKHPGQMSWSSGECRAAATSDLPTLA